MSTAGRASAYVLGSMGPGTKLPTLGHTAYAVIRDAYTEAALGMLEGGADAILVETCQDLLQLKAAVLGSRTGDGPSSGRRIPVIAHVTVETTGTMLLGSEIGAALTALEPLGIDMIGLNCATGPAEMSEHLRYLSQHARTPGVGDAQRGPAGARRQRRRIPAAARRTGRGAVGLRRRVRPVAGRRLLRHHPGTHPQGGRGHPGSAARRAARRPSSPRSRRCTRRCRSQQDASVLMIGERTNANGSKAFREAMIAED